MLLFVSGVQLRAVRVCVFVGGGDGVNNATVVPW